MAKHSPKMLLHGGMCTVPADIAVCPECGGRLIAESTAFIEDNGLPLRDELYIFCKNDTSRTYHRGWQSDWFPVAEVVRDWAGAVNN